MNARALLEELTTLGVELCADGADLEYEGPEEAITPELLDRLKTHKAELLGLLAWDEDEACKLIEDAFPYLCEQYLKAGKPDFDPAAIYAAYELVDKAYKAEDMSELRRAIRAFVLAQLKEFGQHHKLETVDRPSMRSSMLQQSSS